MNNKYQVFSIFVTIIVCIMLIQNSIFLFQTQFLIFGVTDTETGQRKAPIIITDENIYATWWTNNTGNGNSEVLFRASTDGGTTFEDKINLSNTTDAESVDAMIDAEGDSVVVTWWERNNTANEPVMRISTDGGQTFGPLLQLSQNGTLGDNESSD